MKQDEKIANAVSMIIRVAALESYKNLAEIIDDATRAGLCALRQDLESRWVVVSISAFLVGVAVGAVAL
ncbi:MAG: hypothetical protein ACRD98_00165 [Nitrososphaera sp.]